MFTMCIIYRDILPSTLPIWTLLICTEFKVGNMTPILNTKGRDELATGHKTGLWWSEGSSFLSPTSQKWYTTTGHTSESLNSLTKFLKMKYWASQTWTTSTQAIYYLHFNLPCWGFECARARNRKRRHGRSPTGGDIKPSQCDKGDNRDTDKVCMGTVAGMFKVLWGPEEGLYKLSRQEL